MPWINLGTIALSDWEWREFDTPLIEGSTFRISHSYQHPPLGHAVICSTFADGSRYGFKRVYASSQTNILHLPIPQALIQAGLTVRYMSIKRGLYTRVYEGTNWIVALEYFEPDAE